MPSLLTRIRTKQITLELHLEITENRVVFCGMVVISALFVMRVCVRGRPHGTGLYLSHLQIPPFF